MSKYLILLVFLASACVGWTRGPAEGVSLPSVRIGGRSGDETWGVVSNPLNRPIELRIQCSERLFFYLPPKTSERFFTTTYPRELGVENTCRIVSWTVL